LPSTPAATTAVAVGEECERYHFSSRLVVSDDRERESAFVCERETCRREKTNKMGDEGEDYHIESTDAGASATIPMEAGQIKKGG
jgi:hypothetical protein